MPDPRLLSAIEDFVNSRRDPGSSAKVRSFFEKAKKQGIDTSKNAFDFTAEEESKRQDPILNFFHPVGRRKLFEDEVLFLVSDGLPYDSVMSMPVPMRKALIERKLARSMPQEAGDEALAAAARKFRNLGGAPGDMSTPDFGMPGVPEERS